MKGRAAPTGRPALAASLSFTRSPPRRRGKSRTGLGTLRLRRSRSRRASRRRTSFTAWREDGSRWRNWLPPDSAPFRSRLGLRSLPVAARIPLPTGRGSDSAPYRSRLGSAPYRSRLGLRGVWIPLPTGRGSECRSLPVAARNQGEAFRAPRAPRAFRGRTAWRERTADPLLDPENVKRLKAEINACMVDGKPNKTQLTLTYPDYFFARAAAVPKKETLRLWPGEAPNEPKDIATKKASIPARKSNGIFSSPRIISESFILFKLDALQDHKPSSVLCQGKV